MTPKSLSPLKRLTQLSLRFENIVLNETLFASIDIHLPHIETLEVTSLTRMSARFEESAKMLPKLKSFSYFSRDFQ